MRFFDWFRRLRRIRGRSVPMPSGSGMSSPEALRKMAEQLAHTREVEYSCDEVLALMDQFAEMVMRGEDAAQLIPLVQHHLEMCGDCREEFEALLRILRASPVQPVP
jgi:hypothetical protein